MLNHFFVTAAFVMAGAVCLVSLYISFVWLPGKMDRAYQNALRTLATAVETKDSRTLGHAERVAGMAVRIGEKLNLSKAELKWARYGALMRDIGKSAVPHRILNKQEALTDGELRVVRNHVKEGAEIVAQIPMLTPLTEIIRRHHERWDGSGYPDGLRGEAIPLASRIIGLLDDFEAMTSERPYHSAAPKEEALNAIRQGSGVLYDPRVVDAFLQVTAEVQQAETKGQAAAA